MRKIFALTAAALLAGCSQGKWNPENSTLSFSFDSAPIGRTFGDTDGPKAMPPAFGEVGHLADAASGAVVEWRQAPRETNPR